MNWGLAQVTHLTSPERLATMLLSGRFPMRMATSTWSSTRFTTWREGIVAFAGHPLIVTNRVVGVMAMFARQPLTDFALRALAASADGVALGIVRNQSEQHRSALLG